MLMMMFSRSHNDWAWLLRNSFRNNLTGLDVDNMRNNHFPKNDTPTHTDITRLRKGQVGGQVCREMLTYRSREFLSQLVLVDLHVV